MPMRRFFLPIALVASALFLTTAGHTAVPLLEPAPLTNKQPVTDVLDGVKVQDNYRWLEQLNDPKVKAWAEKQNERSQKFLTALPGRAQLAAQIKKLIASSPPSLISLKLAADKIFGLKFDPAKQQPFVVVLNSPDDPSSSRLRP